MRAIRPTRPAWEGQLYTAAVGDSRCKGKPLWVLSNSRLWVTNRLLRVELTNWRLWRELSDAGLVDRVSLAIQDVAQIFGVDRVVIWGGIVDRD